MMKKKWIAGIAGICALALAAGAAGCMFTGKKKAAPVPGADSVMTWDKDSTVVFQPSTPGKGAFYPRMIILKNGDWLVAYDTNDGAESTRCQVSRSKDKGRTWEVLSTASAGTGSAANAQMLQLKNGNLLLAYRLVDGDRKILKVSRSQDNGATWAPLSDIAGAEMDNFRGVWEPHMGFMPDGKVAVMYASEVYQPDYPQVIEMKISPDEGKTWGEPVRVSDDVLSRDGMPVWTTTAEGKILVAFEATDDPEGSRPFIIRYKVSPDGKNWAGERKVLFSPEKPVGARAAAPYVTTLTSGVLMAACQSDKNPTKADMFTLSSRDNGATWKLEAPAFATSGDDHWNGLYPLDDGGVVALTSSNHTGSSQVEIKTGYFR